jgi:hypothetical protein
MLDHEDLKWIATTSTELNSMLQQISRYSDLARQHKGEHNYIEMLGERVELASKTAQALFDRVTSAILAGSTGRAAAAAKEAAHPPFTVVPSPMASRARRRRPATIRSAEGDAIDRRRAAATTSETYRAGADPAGHPRPEPERKSRADPARRR